MSLPPDDIPLLPADYSHPANGWTEALLRECLDRWRDCGDVDVAVRAVGRSKSSLYTMRRRSPALREAMDTIRTELGPKQREKRAQHWGFTPERRATFLTTLAQTGCVRDACRSVGISDTAAYKLRDRDPAFDRAWADALEEGREILEATAFNRAVHGNEVLIYRNGELYERRVTPSDGLLKLMLERGDRGGPVGAPRDDMLSLAEWREGWRFDDAGNKVQDPVDHRAMLADKLIAMRERIIERRGCLPGPKDDEGA